MVFQYRDFDSAFKTKNHRNLVTTKIRPIRKIIFLLYFYVTFLFLYTVYSTLNYGFIITIIIYSFMSFSHQRVSMVSQWSLRNSKSPQLSRTLLSILVVPNNTVVWMVSTHPYIQINPPVYTYKRYMHNPESVLENETHKLLWDHLLVIASKHRYYFKCWQVVFLLLLLAHIVWLRVAF